METKTEENLVVVYFRYCSKTGWSGVQIICICGRLSVFLGDRKYEIRALVVGTKLGVTKAREKKRNGDRVTLMYTAHVAALRIRINSRDWRSFLIAPLF